MKKIIKSDSGYALIFVLMMAAVLGIFLSVLLTMTSNRTLTDNHQKNEKTAEYMADSSMESIIRYMNQYSVSPNGESSTVTPYGYFMDYVNRWMDSGLKKFSLPDGTDVTCKISKQSSSNNNYIIKVTAIAGDKNLDGSIDPGEPNAIQKTISYSMYLPDFLPLRDGKIVLGGDPPDNILPEDYLIDKTITSEMVQGKIDQSLQQYNIDAAYCGHCSTIDEIQEQYDANKGNQNPVIIRTDSSVTISKDATLGGTDVPLILLIDKNDLVFSGNNSDLEIFGAVIVGDNLNFMKNKNSIIVHEANNALGDLLIYNGVNDGSETKSDNKISIIADGDVMVGTNLLAKNSYTFHVGGTMTVGADIYVGKGNSDIKIGGNSQPWDLNPMRQE